MEPITNQVIATLAEEDFQEVSRLEVTGRRYTRCFVLICIAALTTGCTTLPRESQPPAQAPLPPQTSAQTPDTTIVAIAPPAAPSKPAPNLLDFLGINQVHDKVFGGLGYLFRQTQNRLGKYFPGLEPKPPIKSITDPANLSEDSPPAVSAAAKIKAEEDSAEQKIKGLKYLATVGCGGCYPDVEEALLAALDDCTEAVRYEAVKALRGPGRTPCKYCNSGNCCSEAVQKKLREVAYELNSSMCHVEPSERVRRLARLALRNCGPAIPSTQDELPSEGPRASENATSLNQDDQDASPAVALASAEQNPASADVEASSAAKFASTFTSLSDLQYATMPAPRRAEVDSWQSSISPRLRVANSQGKPSEEASQQAPHKYSWERYTLNPDEFRTLEEARSALISIRDHIAGKNSESSLSGLSSEQFQINTVRVASLNDALSPRISEVLAELPIGKISRPIGDEYGWHLIRVIEQHFPDARPQ